MNKETYKAYLRQSLNEILVDRRASIPWPRRPNYDPNDENIESTISRGMIYYGSKTYRDRMAAKSKRDPYCRTCHVGDSLPTDIEKAENDEYINNRRAKEEASRAAEPDKWKKYDEEIVRRRAQAFHDMLLA